MGIIDETRSPDFSDDINILGALMLWESHFETGKGAQMRNLVIFPPPEIWFPARAHNRAIYFDISLERLLKKAEQELAVAGLIRGTTRQDSGREL